MSQPLSSQTNILMNLDQLTEQRESVNTEPLNLPDEDVLHRFEALYTGLVSDVLREFCLLSQALPGYLVPLRPERTVAGFAFTVKSSPNVKISGEMAFRTQMITEMTAHSFIVWDASGDLKATMWGGVMTATAVGLGVRAAAIDGGLRDTHQVLAKDFPVFYKYRSPNGSLGRCQITHYQIPILMGDTLVKPGDLVLGDIDGVIVVPRHLIVPVLQRAEELKATEDTIFGWVAEGQSVEQITAKGGYF